MNPISLVIKYDGSGLLEIDGAGFEFAQFEDGKPTILQVEPHVKPEPLLTLCGQLAEAVFAYVRPEPTRIEREQLIAEEQWRERRKE